MQLDNLIVQLHRVLIIASLVRTILCLCVHVPMSLKLFATELDHENLMEALPSLLHCCCHHLPQVGITIVAATSFLVVYLIDFY